MQFRCTLVLALCVLLAVNTAALRRLNTTFDHSEATELQAGSHFGTEATPDGTAKSVGRVLAQTSSYNCRDFPNNSYCSGELNRCISKALAEGPSCWDSSDYLDEAAAKAHCSDFMRRAYPHWGSIYTKYWNLDVNSCVRQACSDCVSRHLDYLGGPDLGPPCDLAVYNTCGECCAG